MKAQIKNLTIISAILLSTAAISANAMIETGGYNRAMKHVSLMDTNGDNYISNEEYLNFYEAEFAALDENRDGNLSGLEWTRQHFTHEVRLQSGGYQNQAIKAANDGVVTKKAFLEYHRSFIEVTNQKRADKQDGLTTAAKLLGG